MVTAVDVRIHGEIKVATPIQYGCGTGVVLSYLSSQRFGHSQGEYAYCPRESGATLLVLYDDRDGRSIAETDKEI